LLFLPGLEGLHVSFKQGCMSLSSEQASPCCSSQETLGIQTFESTRRKLHCCRELHETLKRLNKGAQKVKAISGSSDNLIFRGSIAFCLKDVQRAAMRATVKEFGGKLNGHVQSGDNFVTNIFNNKMSTAAFPPLSRDFYKTLETVCHLVLLWPLEPRFASASMFRALKRLGLQYYKAF
jgi:hypothetical protein